ncbi:hypothetical protein F5Y05DRAFT_161397 [Hypoxylon sp. FL0543]|nr:hypothetical protein F5Y05DRAFT_161397 [Hypoxylon sp. FL0543]
MGNECGKMLLDPYEMADTQKGGTRRSGRKSEKKRHERSGAKPVVKSEQNGHKRSEVKPAVKSEKKGDERFDVKPAFELELKMSHPKVYVYNRTTSSINFPVVDYSGKQRTEKQAFWPECYMAVCPKSAKLTDFAAALCPPGSKLVAVARLSQTKKTAPFSAFKDAEELCRNSIQLEIWDEGARKTGARQLDASKPDGRQLADRQPAARQPAAGQPAARKPDAKSGRTSWAAAIQDAKKAAEIAASKAKERRHE